MHFRKKNIGLLIISIFVLFGFVDHVIYSTQRSAAQVYRRDVKNDKILNVYYELLTEQLKRRTKNEDIDHYSSKDRLDTLEPLNNKQVDQHNEDLIKIIQKFWMFKPSMEKYRLERSNLSDFSMGQSQVVDDLLRHKEFGFFVECGALDGETRSNSLFFERDRYWQGLLVEASLSNFRQLLQKNRKVYSIPACMGVNTYAEVIQFNEAQNRGRVIDSRQAYGRQQDMGLIHSDSLSPVQCFPLYSMLRALNRTQVDYLSLDVEGSELDVLRTIPWDKVDISVMTVEFKHDSEGKEAIARYVEDKGYKMVMEVTAKRDWANDFVFIKKSLLR